MKTTSKDSCASFWSRWYHSYDNSEVSFWERLLAVFVVLFIGIGGLISVLHGI